ncbi:DRC9 [Scenedesmus sp. PABB004]|nr:DRC9 [Scenedesmus sp. PABB004]
MAPAAAAAAPAAAQAAEAEAEQLSALEAAHAAAVLQAALDRLALLAVVQVDPAAQALELTQSVGDDISSMLAHQKALEGRFSELIAAQPALRAQPNKAPLRRNQAELAEVSQQLRGATKQLCRNLQDSPNVADNVAKVAAHREALAVLLRATLEALDQRGTATPLIAAVLAADQAEAASREMVDAERGATALVKALRSDLASEKQQHEEQMRERRRALAALKEQLRQEKLSLALDARFQRKELAAANQTSRRVQAASLADMEAQLARLRQQLELERSVHGASLDYLGGRAGALGDDAAAWHARREDDGRAKERELEVLRAAHARDLKRLAEAEARLRDERGAKAARDACAAEEAGRAAAEAALRARQAAAAVTIQAAWRGFKARREAKGRRRAKGGKAKKAKPKKAAPGAARRPVPLLLPAGRRLAAAQRLVCGAASGADPYRVLGVERDADTNAINRAYTQKKYAARNAGDDRAAAEIEAAHSALMMRALSARVKGKAVSKDVAYADTEPLFPWRPKRWDATPKVILIVGAMQMAMCAYGFNAPNMSKVIGCMLIGIAGNVLKQNAISPPPKDPSMATEEEAGRSGRNFVRGTLLALLATFAGVLLFGAPEYAGQLSAAIKLPDALTAPGLVVSLKIAGAALCNWLMTAFYY